MFIFSQILTAAEKLCNNQAGLFGHQKGPGGASLIYHREEAQARLQPCMPEVAVMEQRDKFQDNPLDPGTTGV